MREKILKAVSLHPGARKREIMSYVCGERLEVITVVSQLEREGLLRRETYRDIANMELYDKYYVK